MNLESLEWYPRHFWFCKTILLNQFSIIVPLLTAPDFAKSTTLVESAAAYTSNKPTQRCLLGKVELTTGEEAEHNVLQVSFPKYFFVNIFPLFRK